MIFEVQYFDSPEKKRYEVKAKKCIVGRSKKSDLQIDRDGMSRKHLEIEWDGKEFFVTDLNSTNGVFVNGEKIPPGERTIYKNFLPLEIADKITIFVFSDQQIFEQDEAKAVTNLMAKPQAYAANTKKIVDENESTRLFSKNDKEQLKTPKPLSKIKDKSKKKSSGVINILIFGLVGTGYFLYKQREKEKQAEVESQLSLDKQSSNKNKMEFTTKLGANIFKDYLKQNKCQAFGTICNDLKLININEGITSDQGNLIISVNIPQYIEKLKSPLFNKYKINLKHEYILAYFATHPQIIELSKKENSKLIISGFEIKNDIPNILAVLSTDLTNMPILNLNEHRILFNNLYVAGIHRPYHQIFKETLKLKSF